MTMTTTTTTTARTVAANLATTDLRCVDEPLAFAKRIVDADASDSCLACEWTIPAIVEETGCDAALAERAVGLYPDALRRVAKELLDAESTYMVQFFGAETDEDHRALTLLAEEPLALGEIRAACADRDVRAELRDDAGFRRGWVYQDGDYRLI